MGSATNFLPCENISNMDLRWFKQEIVDNKMYCVVCITFGIANKNHVKRPSSNTCFNIWVNSFEVREHQCMSLGHVQDL